MLPEIAPRLVPTTPATAPLEVVIRQKNGKFIAGIPQLGVFAKADDVNAALAALDAKKKAFVMDLEEAGELDRLEIENRQPLTHRVTTFRSVGGLGQFALKTGIVTCCVIVAFVASANLLTSMVEKSIENSAKSIKSVKIGGSEFWMKIESELDRMARPGSDWSETKKQKILMDIRAIAKKWRPFVTDIQSALADPNNPSQPAGTSTNK